MLLAPPITVARPGASFCSWTLPQVLLQVVRRQISLGVSVVVDTPLARVSLYQELESEAKQVRWRSGHVRYVAGAPISGRARWPW